MRWRHECKHEISAADALVIRQRMGIVGRLDPHAAGGSYNVRSLYFDNGSDKALREKMDGVDRRSKWRIRLYDCDASFIRLERKSKRHGLGYKESCRLTAADARSIMDGNTSWMTSDDRPLVRALARSMPYDGMLPRTIVDYVREPLCVPRRQRARDHRPLHPLETRIHGSAGSPHAPCPRSGRPHNIVGQMGRVPAHRNT